MGFFVALLEVTTTASIQTEIDFSNKQEEIVWSIEKFGNKKVKCHQLRNVITYLFYLLYIHIMFTNLMKGALVSRWISLLTATSLTPLTWVHALIPG